MNKKSNNLKRTSAKDFPICEEACKVINALKLGIDKHSLAKLKDSFRGFSRHMQTVMAVRIIDFICFGELMPTGVKHVDFLLQDVLYTMYHDTKNNDYNE